MVINIFGAKIRLFINRNAQNLIGFETVIRAQPYTYIQYGPFGINIYGSFKLI